MVKDSLGLIETIGLAAAVEAADAAVKSANVRLIGYELTKGGGMVVVKVGGDVGAVKAAVDAGVAAARKVNTVYASHVIPRPHQQISGMVWTGDTVGWKPPAEPAKAPASTASPSEPPVPVTIEEEPAVCPQSADEQVTDTADEPLPAEETVPAATETHPSANNAEGVTEETEGPVEPEQQENTQEPPPRKRPEDICNLCGDPACPRVKGDPRVTCIHFEKNNNKEAE